MRPAKAAAANQVRDLFTREDLGKIFSWLPLLGLYYGARINELCQLRFGFPPNRLGHLVHRYRAGRR